MKSSRVLKNKPSQAKKEWRGVTNILCGCVKLGITEYTSAVLGGVEEVYVGRRK
jgi:hypothetical protein